MLDKLNEIMVASMKNAGLRSELIGRVMFRAYPFFFSPLQLMFLTERLREASKVPGCLIEAGCAWGATTVFLRRFMCESGIERDYYAIDSFSGFPAEQVTYEIEHRDKSSLIAQRFRQNKKAWFDRTITLNGVEPVNSVATDVVHFDFQAIQPIAFALVDVDLYIPTREILPKIYRCLSPGGIIVVDDCKPNSIWDGALKAYQEFVADIGATNEIACGKLGVIRKKAG